jgi:hypothetical protein
VLVESSALRAAGQGRLAIRLEIKRTNPASNAGALRFGFIETAGNFVANPHKKNTGEKD